MATLVSTAARAAAVVFVLGPATPAFADCAHVPFEWHQAQATAVHVAKADFKVTFKRSTKTKSDGKADMDLHKEPGGPALDIKVVTIDKRTLLHHTTTHGDIKQIMVVDEKTRLKTWFSPNPCQSLLFACAREGDASAFDYQFRVKEGQQLKLAVIENGRYPLVDEQDKVGFTDELQGTPSGTYTGMDQAIDQFCKFAAAHKLDGWRQPTDQDEIMLCTQTQPWLKLEQVAKKAYECIAPGDAPRPYDELSIVNFGHDETRRCSGIQGGGIVTSGDLTPERYTKWKQTMSGVQWIKYDAKNIELTSTISCALGQEPKFECDCKLESEVPPPRPVTPTPTKPPVLKKKGMFTVLREIIFGN
jgi:hypothetical protein